MSTDSLTVKFYEVFQEEKNEIKSFLPPDINAEFTWKTVQAEGESSPAADIISIRTQSRIPANWVEGLKGVLTRSQGYDHVLEIQEFLGKNVKYGYLPDYCATAVAEQAIILALCLRRCLKKQMNQFHTFHREEMTGFEAAEANCLVVGVGNIGEEIAGMAGALQMNVRGVDIIHNVADLEYVSIEEGLAWANVIICALPLTDKTLHLLDYKALCQVKPGTVLVNISRGEITPTQDLKRLIDDSILAGVALDVYENEHVLAECLRQGRRSDEPSVLAAITMKDYDNVIFTPHNAFNSYKSTRLKAQRAVESIVQFIKKGSFPDPVE